MHKILVVNEFGQNEAVELVAVPRIGDTIPLFNKPFPKVTSVCWMPENVMPELDGTNTDAVITVA